VREGFSFVGFENFSKIFDQIATDSIFRGALWNTLLVFVLGLLIGTTIPVLVSYYIYKKRLFFKAFRVLLFLPSIISSLVLVLAYKYFMEVAVPQIWFNLFDKTIEGLLSNTETDFFFVLFFTYWFGMGSTFLLYVSTMCSISDAVVESAELDGFTPFQEFRYITFPLVYPTYVTFVVVNISTLFTNQINLFSMFSSYAPDSMYTLVYWMYKETARATIGGYPYLAAMGILCTVIAVPLCLGIKYLLEKFGPSVD
jgi:fructooligosaccharide transport system permease protein